MKVDFVGRRILTKYEIIYLTEIQNIILELLYKNRGKVITYEQMLEEVYNYKGKYSYTLESALKKNVCLLKKKVKRCINITNIRSIGYIIEEDIK